MNATLNTQHSTLTLAALVLAGGQSSRMGQDKALISWDGQPLLQRVCQVASECCEQVYVLTPWSERYQSILTSEYQFLPESIHGQGPLVALEFALTQIPAEWVLLLACDLPLLQQDILQEWASLLATLPPDILALVPKQGELWQPLCGFYRQEAIANLQPFIQQGGRSFQTWLDHLPVQSLPVGQRESRMLRNCNTPLDLHPRMKA